MNQKKMAKVYLAPNYADIAKSLKYELTNFFFEIKVAIRPFSANST